MTDVAVAAVWVYLLTWEKLGGTYKIESHLHITTSNFLRSALLPLKLVYLYLFTFNIFP